MSEEFRAHVALRADDLVRAGKSRDAAERQARIEFGSVAHYKDLGADARGLRAWDDLRFSALDFKLGVRMLARYPGLSIVGIAAMAFAIASGACTFEFIKQVVHPSLPLSEGQRVVAVRVWDIANQRPEGRLRQDYLDWRREVTTIRDIAAYRLVDVNLITEDGGAGAPLSVAEMNASAFRVARVPALLGRTLTDADEEPSAAPAVVVGYDVWQGRLNSDPAVVGRTVWLGRERATIVGVMPRGFAFPLSQDAWTPLRLRAASGPDDRGPSGLRIVGRLAPGASTAEAQAELRTIQARTTRPTDSRLETEVVPLGESTTNLSALEYSALLSVNVFLGMFMILVCGNVALLLYARATTREGEIVIRAALGASRRRIVTQLFAESLALAAIAACLGLAGAEFAMRGVIATARIVQGRLPFWISDHLSTSTILYALLLTLLGAVVVGVLPALRVTSGIDSRLRRAASSIGGFGFGGLWTVVIVSQVAVTVAFPATAFFAYRDAAQVRSLDVGFPAGQYLSARLTVDPTGDTVSPLRAQDGLPGTESALAQQLLADSAVAGVTFTSALPGSDHPQHEVDIDGAAASEESGQRRVSVVSVATNYFAALGAVPRLGRPLDANDGATGGGGVVVNDAFVRQMLRGRNPLGVRVRFAESIEPDGAGARPDYGPWHPIVGVVKNLGMTDGSDPHESGAGVYVARSRDDDGTVYALIHLRGDAQLLARRLRLIAARVDPSMRVDAIVPLAQIRRDDLRADEFWLRLLITVSGLALTLSLVAIYAVMAFTVVRRTREIGVRVALGASPYRVLATIFERPARQIVWGIAVGSVIVAWLVFEVIGTISAAEIALMAAHAGAMLAVCTVACIVPTRRALRIEPTVALRIDG
jgi:predicted permease